MLLYLSREPRHVANEIGSHTSVVLTMIHFGTARWLTVVGAIWARPSSLTPPEATTPSFVLKIRARPRRTSHESRYSKPLAVA
jgi:hypothetical protein